MMLGVSVNRLLKLPLLRAWVATVLVVGCGLLLVSASNQGTRGRSFNSVSLAFASIKGDVPLTEWAESVRSRIDPGANTWVHTHQDSLFCKNDFIALLEEGRPPCGLVQQGGTREGEPTVRVLISTSMPRAALLDLASDLETVGGALVLSGIPDRSWSNLVDWIDHMETEGMDCEIQLDPRPFRDHAVTRVPAFLLEEEECFDLVSGNVSLDWALSRMSEQGETKGASRLLSILRGEG